MEAIVNVNAVPIKAPRKKPMAWRFASKPPTVSLMLRSFERKNQKIDPIKRIIPNKNDGLRSLKINKARKLPIKAEICMTPIVLQHTKIM